MMISYESMILIMWGILMVTKHELLSEMTSKNPMIPYTLGTLYISIIFSTAIYIIYIVLKIIKETLCKE